jgi:hypothetical protein
MVGHNTHLNSIEEQLRRVMSPCIEVKVVHYIMFDHNHAAAFNTPPQSIDQEEI